MPESCVWKILIDQTSQRFPHINPVEADRVLHGEWANGTLIYGLDVTQQAWALVGRHRWLKPLRLPLIRWFADFGAICFLLNIDVRFALTTEAFPMRY